MKIVYLLIFGILLVRMALFMSYPYLALYLAEMNFTSVDIGIILGAHYLCASLIGVLGGYVSDLTSPKRILIIVLIIGSSAFLGLSCSKTFVEFLVWNSFLAFITAIFEPIATVLITANIPSSLHALALRYRYMAINVGAALGPFIGTFLYLNGSKFSFHITALLLAFYSLLFLFVKVENRKKELIPGAKNLKEALAHMMNNRPFLFLIGANLFITMTYIQIFSTMPQILSNVENGRYLYSILITINPLIVILTCLFFNRFLSKQSLIKMFNIGTILLAVSFMGFHFTSINFANYIFFMVLFTLAEILLIPSTSKYLLDLSIEKYKGAYLGAESSTYLGFFIGNLIGGVLLQYGQGIFLCCACFAIVGFFFYQFSYKQKTYKQRSVYDSEK